jgi:hypothetical protein
MRPSPRQEKQGSPSDSPGCCPSSNLRAIVCPPAASSTFRLLSRIVRRAGLATQRQTFVRRRPAWISPDGRSQTAVPVLDSGRMWGRRKESVFAPTDRERKFRVSFATFFFQRTGSTRTRRRYRASTHKPGEHVHRQQRRAFISLLGRVAVWPVTVRAWSAPPDRGSCNSSA